MAEDGDKRGRLKITPAPKTVGGRKVGKNCKESTRKQTERGGLGV